MSTLGGYHEYNGGCSVHQGDTMSTLGDIMSTSGGYHEYIGKLKGFYQVAPPHVS